MKSRNLLWIIPLLLLLSFPAWRIPVASFLSPRGGFDQSFGQKQEQPHNFLMNEVTIIQNQTGKKTAEVAATRANTTDQINEYVLSEVNADLFGDKEEEVNVIAAQGTYNTDSKKLSLKNEVVVTRKSENQKLFTDLLHYYGEQRKLHAPVATRLKGPNIEILGSSLEYDVATNSYKIGGRVYCTINDPEPTAPN